MIVFSFFLHILSMLENFTFFMIMCIETKLEVRISRVVPLICLAKIITMMVKIGFNVWYCVLQPSVG